MDNNLVNAKKKTAVQVKSIFGARADESLSACLKNWYSKQSEKSKSHIYAENITGFMTYIFKNCITAIVMAYCLWYFFKKNFSWVKFYALKYFSKRVHSFESIFFQIALLIFFKKLF